MKADTCNFTLFEVANGGSAKYIIENMASYGHYLDEKEFLKEWKAFYKLHTGSNSTFMREHGRYKWLPGAE